MEHHARVLAERLLSELYPKKLPLLDASLKMLNRHRAANASEKREGIPFIDPSLVSTFAEPMVIGIVSGIIVQIILKAGKKWVESHAENETVKIIVKQGRAESLELALDMGVDRRTASKILRKVFRIMEANPEILQIDYKKR